MPGIKEFVQWISENYEIGLFSNNMPGFIDKLIEQGSIPKLNYKTIVDSSKTGYVKPDPKIYDLAKQLAGVDSSEILLIDDSRANLTAADKLGWHVLWFDDFRAVDSIEKAKAALAF
jgi:putative hydrolase of the HAD superfamily